MQPFRPCTAIATPTNPQRKLSHHPPAPNQETWLRRTAWRTAGTDSRHHLNADSSVAAGLVDVKAQIEADQRARSARAKAI
jgi:hypothetical protein